MTVTRPHTSDDDLSQKAVESRPTKYQRRKREGVCVDCQGPPQPGRVRCLKCLRKRSDNQTAYLHNKNPGWRRGEMERLRKELEAIHPDRDGCDDVW